MVHNRVMLALLLSLFLSPASAFDRQGEKEARSVVQISVFSRRPNLAQPWQMSPEESATGSGCVIAGDRILTNAHVVSGQVYLQVRKAGDPKKYAARVEFTAHDSELAVLKVNDPSFYKGTEPLALGALPRQRDRVFAYGFPVGGEDLSVTEGIVSRIEVTDYAHSGRGLLTIQTDAAINPGNSGGPALLEGKLIGITFQYDQEAQSTGYIVPVPIIERFLKDIEDGRYDGVPDLGIRYQALENEALREFAGLGAGETGIRVSTTAFGSSAWGALESGDVLTRVDGVPVADDGSVPLRGKERVLFTHLLAVRQIGEKIRLTVLRKGARVEAEVPLRTISSLAGDPLYDVRPSYLIYGGLVFMPLTRDLLAEGGEDEVPSELRFYLEHGLPSPERRQLILLRKVLPHEVNAGYEGFRDLVIERVNGRAVADMELLLRALSSPQGRFLVVETDGLSSPGGLIVLDARKAEQATGEILKTYGIEADRSEDLR